MSGGQVGIEFQGHNMVKKSTKLLKLLHNREGSWIHKTKVQPFLPPPYDLFEEDPKLIFPK